MVARSPSCIFTHHFSWVPRPPQRWKAPGDSATMLVHEFLERSAQSRPDSLAILHGDEGVTYGAIERGANGIAHALLASGIRPDDRVGLLVENSRFYVESFFGVLKAGAIVVPLNHTADARTLRGMLHDLSLIHI